MLLVHILNVAFVHFRLVLIGCRLVYNVVNSYTDCSICSFSSCFDWLPAWLVAGLSVMLLVRVLNVAFVHSRLVLTGCGLVGCWLVLSIMLLVHVLNATFVHSRLLLIACRLVCNVVSSCTECSICSFSSCFDWSPHCV